MTIFEKFAAAIMDDIPKDAKDTAAGLATGALAGGISTAIVQPLSQISNIKSTFGSNEKMKGRVHNYRDVVKAIYRGNTGEIPKAVTEYDKGLKGVKNFYHGLGGKLVQTAPQSAILLGANALLYKAYKDSKHNKATKPEMHTNG